MPLFRRRRAQPAVDERRTYERFPLGLKTNIVAVGSQPLPQPLRVELLDIGGGGMRLGVKTYFEVGSPLTATFSLPGEQRMNDAQVEVLSCDPRGQDFVARCKFTELRMGGELLDWMLVRIAGGR